MIDVTCAIIRNDDDEVLIVQRGPDSDHPLKWEFPGGKINAGESAEECILREINEELSLDLVIFDTLTIVEHDYGNKQVRLIPFICDTIMDLPILTEHVDYRWIKTEELSQVDFSEADIPVSQEYLEKFAKANTNITSKDTKAIDDISGIKELLSGKTGFGAIDLVTGLASARSEVISLLLDFSLDADQTLAFRSSYVIVKLAESNKELLKPYYYNIINSMPGLTNESVIRSFLKVINLAGVEVLKQEEHGILAECCFNWLNNGKSAVAIKAYTMEALCNLSEVYPDLTLELTASISRNMEGGSAGIKARGRQILNKLSRRG